MKLIETIGYQGGSLFIAADKILAMQHRKSVGDMTPNGVANRPQTTVFMQTEQGSEEWIVLESVSDLKKKYEEQK